MNIINFISKWNKGLINWSSNNFEKVQLGKVKQYKWYTCSLSSHSFNFTYYNWFFGIGIGWLDLYIIPTLRICLPHKYNRKEDFTINILWFNIAIALNIGHWLFCPFKGYKSEIEIENYIKYKNDLKKL